jgi:hypothetical protein
MGTISRVVIAIHPSIGYLHRQQRACPFPSRREEGCKALPETLGRGLAKSETFRLSAVCYPRRPDGPPIKINERLYETPMPIIIAAAIIPLAWSMSMAAEPEEPGHVDFGTFSPPASGGEFVEVNLSSNIISVAARWCQGTKPKSLNC